MCSDAGVEDMAWLDEDNLLRYVFLKFSLPNSYSLTI